MCPVVWSFFSDEINIKYGSRKGAMTFTGTFEITSRHVGALREVICKEFTNEMKTRTE